MQQNVSVFDVAKIILAKQGEMSHLKLQKLVFYSQAWSLVWDDSVLFDDRVEAWANGPVVPELFRKLQGLYTVTEETLDEGDSGKLSSDQRETVDAVLGFYGDKSSQWLSDLTHMEEPWQNARVGLSAGERGTNEISTASMADYYSSLNSPA